MALSMTGFGRGTLANEFFAIRIELRAVNHRFLEISLRLPRSLSQFEDRLRRAIGAQLGRGKIDASIHLEILGSGLTRVCLDNSLATGYRDALLELAARFGLSTRLSLDHFTQLPDLFSIESTALEDETLWDGLSQALSNALRDLTVMRRTEGDKLAADLLQRIEAVESLAKTVEIRAPQVPAGYRIQLQRRLNEALGQPGIDETRLAQEIAIYADRCNITEELVRMQSHLEQLRATLRMEGALGRKADFILQEINREVNTIGAKANDLAIAQAVIEIKTELEKIREQVQNLE